MLSGPISTSGSSGTAELRRFDHDPRACFGFAVRRQRRTPHAAATVGAADDFEMAEDEQVSHCRLRTIYRGRR
jgi:hypothetical protein